MYRTFVAMRKKMLGITVLLLSLQVTRRTPSFSGCPGPTPASRLQRSLQVKLCCVCCLSLRPRLLLLLPERCGLTLITLTHQTTEVKLLASYVSGFTPSDCSVCRAAVPRRPLGVLSNGGAESVLLHHRIPPDVLQVL